MESNWWCKITRIVAARSLRDIYLPSCSYVIMTCMVSSMPLELQGFHATCGKRKRMIVYCGILSYVYVSQIERSFKTVTHRDRKARATGGGNHPENVLLLIQTNSASIKCHDLNVQFWLITHFLYAFIYSADVKWLLHPIYKVNNSIFLLKV